MFHFDDPQLAERVNRHKAAPDYGEGRAVLLALCESIVNSDMPDDEKLAKIQQCLLSDLKLAAFAKKHALDAGDLITRETCLDFLRFAMGVLGGVVREYVDDDTNARIVDAFVPTLAEAMRDQPLTRQLLESK